MRQRHGPGFLLALLVASACGQETSGTAALESEDQIASYGIGVQMGAQLAPAGDRLDLDAFMLGLEDAMEEVEPRVPEEEVQTALQSFSAAIQQEREAEQLAAAETNTEEGETYLAENGGREGVVTTESGVQYEVLREGDGPNPQATDRVSLHYRGTLVDGTEFDVTYGGDPAEFPVNGVIAGFTEALQLMSAGSHYRVVIPGPLAYGRGGGGPIGPNATLVFEIELLEIL